MGCEIVIYLIFGIILLQILMKLHGEGYYKDEE